MANKSETVNINVLIAERTYPLKVLKTDEQKLHNAAKLVNEKISEYRDTFAGKDKQDYMAMCLLNFVVERMSNEEQQVQTDRLLEEKINRVDAVLSGVSE